MKKHLGLWRRGSITLYLSLFLFVFVRAQNLQLHGRVSEAGSQKAVAGAAIQIRIQKNPPFPVVMEHLAFPQPRVMRSSLPILVMKQKQ